MASCALCKSNRDDADQYGDMMSKGGVSVHTFCLYLSSKLAQRGEDHEGFLGFLPEDIQVERKRVALLRCCYCRCKGANVGCCAKKCRRSFHTTCGIEHGAMNQFFGTYESFCDRHVCKVSYLPSLNEHCCICYDQLRDSDKRFDSVRMLFASCCRNGWFHKLCLQRCANTAGYFFKCPLCNNTDVFRQEVASHGIYIPKRDAAWELEPNAYGELLERPNRCAANHCYSAVRHGDADDTLLLCETCGSEAMHKRCIPNALSRFQCEICRQMLSVDSRRDKMQEAVNDNQNEDIELDVCGHSDIENEIAEKETVKETLTQRSTVEQQQDEVESDVEWTQLRRVRKCYNNCLRSSDSEDGDVKVERKRKECKRKNPLNTRTATDADDTSTDDDDFKELSLKQLAKANCVYSDKSRVCNVVISSSVSDDTASDSDPLENFADIMERLAANARNDDNSAKASKQPNQAKRAASPSFSNDSQNMLRRGVVKLKRLPTSKTVTDAKPAKRLRLSSTGSAADNSQSLLNVSCIARRTRRRLKSATTQDTLSTRVEPDINFYVEDVTKRVSSRDCTSPNSSSSDVQSSSVRSIYSCSSTPLSTITSTAMPTSSDKRSPVTDARDRWPCTLTQRRLASSEVGDVASSLSGTTATQRISTRFAANLHCLRNESKAYFMPKFARIGGKLCRIRDNTPLGENHAVRRKFVRSYKLLVNDNSENRQRQYQR